MVGFGTWQMANDEHTIKVIENAIMLGIVTSIRRQIMQTKKVLVVALKIVVIPREELFVTTKLHNRDHTSELAKQAIDESEIIRFKLY